MGREEILVAGAGGQGVLFFGTMISLIAAQKGKKVISIPSYGAAMRGGEVKCGVVISDEEIHDPAVENADFVVTLNEASLKKYGSKVKEGGVLICAESEKTAAIVSSFGKEFQLISVPFGNLGPEKYHNMIAMGIFAEMDTNLNVDMIEEALTKEMKKKGKGSLLEENLKAIKAGRDWYVEKRRKQIVSDR